MCLASVAINGLDRDFVPEQTLKIDLRTSFRCHMKLTSKIAVNGLDRDFVPEQMLKLERSNKFGLLYEALQDLRSSNKDSDEFCKALRDGRVNSMPLRTWNAVNDRALHVAVVTSVPARAHQYLAFLGHWADSPLERLSSQLDL